MRPCLVGVLLLVAHLGLAQHWRGLSRGAIGPGKPVTLSTDSVLDRLIVSGTFIHMMNEVDTILGAGMAAWNGSRWDSIGHRIQTIVGISVQPVWWFIRFNNRLYTCGAFSMVLPGGGSNRWIAYLDDATQRWVPLECLNNVNGDLSTLVPKQPGNRLFLTGFPGSLCGYAEAAVFEYDAMGFHEWAPWHQIPVWSNNYVGWVFDFQGMTYMTGLFRDPLSTGYCSLMRHNGVAWEYVPGWGTQTGPIKDLVIRNDTLWVCGAFRTASGGPGNAVASFDGTTWDDLGGGVQLAVAPVYTSALALQWFHNELYLGGQFTTAGGIPANGFAKWNGQQWCSLPGFDQQPGPAVTMVTDMADWHDSLYIAGGFTELEGQPINRVAQWIGGDAVSGCSPPVAVPERRLGSGIVLAPNPATNNITITSSQCMIIRYRVYDINGRLVDGEKVGAPQFILPRNGLEPGTYLVQLELTDGVVTRKLMFD